MITWQACGISCKWFHIDSKSTDVYELIVFRAAKYASEAKIIFGVMNEVRNSGGEGIPQDV